MTPLIETIPLAYHDWRTYFFATLEEQDKIYETIIDMQTARTEKVLLGSDFQGFSINSDKVIEDAVARYVQRKVLEREKIEEQIKSVFAQSYFRYLWCLHSVLGMSKLFFDDDEIKRSYHVNRKLIQQSSNFTKFAVAEFGKDVLLRFDGQVRQMYFQIYNEALCFGADYGYAVGVIANDEKISSVEAFEKYAVWRADRFDLLITRYIAVLRTYEFEGCEDILTVFDIVDEERQRVGFIQDLWIKDTQLRGGSLPSPLTSESAGWLL